MALGYNKASRYRGNEAMTMDLRGMVSGRMITPLYVANIIFMGQLVDYSMEELMTVRGSGPKVAQQLNDLVADQGFEFRHPNDPPLPLRNRDLSDLGIAFSGSIAWDKSIRPSQPLKKQTETEIGKLKSHLQRLYATSFESAAQGRHNNAEPGSPAPLFRTTRANTNTLG